MPNAPKPKKTTTAKSATPAPEPTATPVTPTPAASATSSAAPAAKKNNTKVVVIIVAIVGFFFIIVPIALLIAGVWIFNDKLKDNGVSVDSNTRSLSVSDGNGNTFSAGGEQGLPDGFPSEVSLYDNGQITASGRANVSGETGWVVTVTTSDSLTTVMNSIANTYSQNGWTTDFNSGSDSGALFSATKGNLRVSVAGANKDGQTNVVYTVNTMSSDEMQ